MLNIPTENFRHIFLELVELNWFVVIKLLGEKGWVCFLSRDHTSTALETQNKSRGRIFQEILSSDFFLALFQIAVFSMLTQRLFVSHNISSVQALTPKMFVHVRS